MKPINLIKVCTSTLLTLISSTFAYSDNIPLEYDWQSSFSVIENKSVYDYYMLIPSCFIDCEMAYFGLFDSEKNA
ncbi:hypothetical protein BCF53_10613 [Reinekea marinisedimentorum]|uniref:Uncharacterized protein n=1 Tax=Reinekea marinisedimentorum TaxID=230495 RepID=A0A4R3I7U4_9GAMM|nr:hypothetical protein BCF53_10613 [Reinekea marinisedimentorum]